MTRVTAFVVRHKVLVILFWVVLAAAGAATTSGTSDRLNTSYTLTGAAADTSTQIAALYHRDQANYPLIPMVTLPHGHRVTDRGQRPKLRALFDAAGQAVPGAQVIDYFTTGDPVFLTHDGRSTYALVFVPKDGEDGNTHAAAIEAAVRNAAPPGWSVGLTGIGALEKSKPEHKGAGVATEAAVGAIGSLVILALVFGSLLAVVPLLVAAVSVLITFLLVGGLTEITSVSQVVQYLIALVGLGVAIDYSLLIVTRWREERSNGKDNRAAVQAAMKHAGHAVFFSGLSVAICLLALIVIPVPFLRSVGYGGVLIPLVSTAVACTLLPVLLDSIGPALDRFRLRTDRNASRVWSGWARIVYRHRWVAALGGAAVLAALVLPVFSMQVGEPASTTLSTGGPARDSLDLLTRGGVPTGVLTPMQVLTDGSAAPDVADHASGVDGVVTAISPITGDGQFRHAGTAIVTVVPRAETSLGAGQDTVTRLRDALDEVDGVRGITGPGPITVDFSHAVYGSFPLMLGLISLATFLLLARAFRSVLLAAKAVVFNLVSLGAAYGVLTLVWQQGHGSQTVWGIPATGAITMWIPVMVFAFLFGLSMDYEVFILARIRETYDETGDAEHAVIEGIGRTGRLVTSAAAILMLSFLSMSTSPETDIKLLATGLGAGILIDAVVVRCLMVPAMVALFGRWNWWLPPALARLVRVPAYRYREGVRPQPADAQDAPALHEV